MKRDSHSAEVAAGFPVSDGGADFWVHLITPQLFSASTINAGQFRTNAVQT